MKKFINKYVAPIIPLYALLPLIFSLLLNGFVYFGGQQISKGFYHYNLTNDIDKNIPFISSFVIFYCLWYLFYVLNYVLITRESKEKCFRFLTADLIAKVVCFCFFIFFPTKMYLRPVITENSVFDCLVRLIYMIDLPTSLFPSMHSLVSWFCFIGLIDSKKIPRWYKAVSFAIAILIILSTLLIKQHVLIDAISGVILAQITYLIGMNTKLYKTLERIFDKITNKLLY